MTSNIRILSDKPLNTYSYNNYHFQHSFINDMETIVIKEEPQDVEEFLANSNEINIDESMLNESATDIIDADLYQVSAEYLSTLHNIKTEQNDDLLVLPTDVEIKEEPLPFSPQHQNVTSNSLTSHNESASTSNPTPNSNGPTNERELKCMERSLLLVFTRISSHRYGSRFLRPVNDIMAPEYSRAVKHAIDLSIIRKKIKARIIRSTAHFQRDLLLMLTNAMMYNSSDGNIYHMAKELIEEVRTQVAILIQAQEQSLSPIYMSPKRNLRKKDRPNPFTLTVSKTIKSELIQKHNKRKKQVKKPVKPENNSSNIDINMVGSIIDKAYVKIRRLSNDLLSTHKGNTSTSSTNDVNTNNKNAEPNWNPAKIIIGNRRSTVKVRDTKQNIARDAKEKINARMRNIKKEKRDSLTIAQQKKTTLEAKTYQQPARNVTPEDLAVAITTVPRRDLTKEEANKIKKSLEDSILAIALDTSATKFAPIFRDKAIITDGVLKLWCDDARSLNWLKQIILTTPIVNGKLIVRKQSELPWRVKSGVLIPGVAETNVILCLLRAQNPWADIVSWVVYSVEQQGDDVFLVFGIPSTLIPDIIAKERRLAYSLGSVFVKFFKGSVLSDDPPL